MNWYYASQNERRGPVADDALLGLLVSRAIDLETLVWREGLSEWVPLSSVRSELSGAAQPPALPVGAAPIGGGATVRCVECGFLFPRAEILELDGRFVCAGCKPTYLQKLREGVPVGGAGGLWRRKRELVVALNSPMPDRCVKCNADAGGSRLKRDLYWHHPALYLMILFPGLIFYVLVALLVRKRATLHVGICGLHRAKRSRAVLVSWSLFFVGVGLIVLGANALEGNQAGSCIGLGIVTILGSLIGGVITTRVVYARKIDTKQAFVRGVCRAFLEPLPEWRER